MNINLFKNLSVAAVCLSSAAFAGMDIDSRVSQLEMQMKQVRTATDNNSFGAKTAEAGPKIVDGYDVTLGIGVIYQTATMGGTEFAYSENDVTADLPHDGDLAESGDSWAWGVNAMIGFDFERDGWDVKITNSYFDTDDSTSVSSGFGGAVVPLRVLSTIIPGECFEYSSEARSNLNITYDLLGLELGRNYFVSEHLSMRPNYGLLASWVWSTNKISYSGGDFLNENSVYTRDHSNWFGIGPQFGLNTSWGLGKGIAIFADTKGALMYGRFKVQHEEHYSLSTDNPDVEISAYGHRLIPYVQAILGLSYNFFSDNNKNSFTLRAGYNVQFFLGANQTLRPASEACGSDTTAVREVFYRENNNLQTQGLIIDAAWTF